MMIQVLPANTQPEPAPPSRTRPMRRFVAAGAAGALALLGVAAYVFASPYLFASGFRAANYYPSDTWMFGDLTVRPGFSQFWAARTLREAFTSQAGFEEAVQALQSSQPSPSDLDYEKDVLPLLDGEVAFGASGPTRQPDVVAMLHSSDPDKLLGVIQAADKSPEPRQRYAATSNGWVVLGSSQAAVDQTLARLQAVSDDSLAHSDRYLSVVNRLPGDRAGFVYLDTQPLASLPSVGGAFGMRGSPFPELEAASTGRVAMSLAAATDGLDMRWESIPDQPLHTEQTFARGDAMNAFEQMPADTLFAVAGDSLPELLADTEAALRTSLPRELQSMTLRPVFDASRWMGGEFAVGLTRGTLQRSPSGATQGSPELFVLAKVKDSGAADQDLGALDKLLAPTSTTVQGVPFKHFHAAPDTNLYYGVGNDWLYFLLGDPQKVLGQRQSTASGLASNAQFGLVRRAFDSDGVSVFVNLEDSRRTMEDFMSAAERERYEPKRPLLVPFKALGGSFRTDESGDAHGRLLLGITK